MSNKPKLSAATRASSAYVQGLLESLIGAHGFHEDCHACGLHRRLAAIVLTWKQAEAELKAEVSEHAATLERNIEREDR